MAAIKFVLLSFLFLVISVFDCGNGSAVKYVSYNSSDLSYLSNGIQFPAPNSDDVITVQLANKENLLPEMEWFGKLYNHFYWENQISVLEDEQCRKHMNEYIRGLRNGTSWASKSN